MKLKLFFPATIELALAAMLVTTTVGVFFGVYAAHHRKRATDYGIRVTSIILYAIPIFWLGLMLQMIFGAQLGWLPVAGRLSAGNTPEQNITGLYTIDAILTGDLGLICGCR